MLKVSKETNKALESLGSTYRTSAISGSPEYEAEIIDRATGKVYAKARAASEAEAVEKAAADAQVAERPQTPAELAQENASLKKRLAELEGKKAPKANKSDAPKPTAKPPRPEPDADGDGKLTISELKQALKARNIAIPEGDQRTKEWWDAAYALLNEYEAGEQE